MLNHVYRWWTFKKKGIDEFTQVRALNHAQVALASEGALVFRRHFRDHHFGQFGLLGTRSFVLHHEV